MTSTNISPFSRLYVDVLREIFVYCARPFYLHCLYRKSFCRYVQLTPVSQVCSSWRHVALLTPQLWNDILIYDLTEANLSIAREYLSRARSLPISIALHDKPKIIEHGWRSLLVEFLSSYRLRSLQVSASNPHIYLILPDLPQRSVADLEELCINHQFHNLNGLPIELNDIRYPKLTVVGCRCYVLGCSSILRVFDCSRVLMTVIESWDFLSHCPSLEKCCFMLKEDCSSPGPISAPQILLQHLTTLEVESGGRHVMPFSTFIKALALPNLENLVVAHSLRVEWSTTAFQSFSQRSNHFPNLHQFVLRTRYPTSDVDAGPLLASMPSITSMHLFQYRYPDNPEVIFDHTTLNDLASGSLAPRLQFLEVGYVSNVEEFMDMLESRDKNAEMSSNGVPAPFWRVRFRGVDRDDMTSGEQIIRYPV